MSLRKSIITTALKEYGVNEKKGEEHEARILQYFHDIGFEQIDNDETPWCAAFANWVLKCNGLKGSKKLNAKSLSKIGRKKDLSKEVAEIGDLIIFNRGSEAWMGHVGFLVRFCPIRKMFGVLGGNQSNEVKVSWYAPSKLYCVIDANSLKEIK